MSTQFPFHSEYHNIILKCFISYQGIHIFVISAWLLFSYNSSLDAVYYWYQSWILCIDYETDVEISSGFSRAPWLCEFCSGKHIVPVSVWMFASLGYVCVVYYTWNNLSTNLNMPGFEALLLPIVKLCIILNNELGWVHFYRKGKYFQVLFCHRNSIFLKEGFLIAVQNQHE